MQSSRAVRQLLDEALAPYPANLVIVSKARILGVVAAGAWLAVRIVRSVPQAGRQANALNDVVATSCQGKATP